MTTITLSGTTLDAALNATIVSAGTIGTAWGDFNNFAYSEVWSLTFVEASAVPVPAAVWLFGSGFIGLTGIARCKV